MKGYCFAWHTRLLGAALMTALLLSVTQASGQVAVPAKTEDEKPPPSTKKTGDEEPPLPSRKPVPAKQVRIQVTTASAEVQSGDKVVATVERGQV
ncbi:MAG TPA: hypothetical protein VH682_31490, partial [Gemmataceae bacterium]